MKWNLLAARGFRCSRNFYRPNPKDGKGTVFTGVCLSTGGGGGVTMCSLVLGPFPGLCSLVLSRGYPSPVTSPFHAGLGYSNLGHGVPPHWPGQGYPPPRALTAQNQDGTEGTAEKRKSSLGDCTRPRRGLSLPPASEVCEKVMFSVMFVRPQGVPIPWWNGTASPLRRTRPGRTVPLSQKDKDRIDPCPPTPKFTTHTHRIGMENVGSWPLSKRLSC